MARLTGQFVGAGRGEQSPGAVKLPILGSDGRFQKDTTMGRRRAVILGLVQLAIILHVVIWILSREYGWFGGRTITPIEPSESMEFSKYGVINAGLIFFLLAMLSTLVLGRWFCGWACHVILLQDLCLWIMGRFKIRPRPFRSRLLMWAPLILALYMFIWPLFYRFAIAPFTRPNLEWPGISVHLTTTDFWKTFPGFGVAVIFLGVCGFATVYFLGAKGFCTYGCPYGGFFAPLDRASPFRIRVRESCDDCGQCTAACTSNVKVHEEIRVWGMVTDPGCMKTMDCVQNCPEDALYFGAGKTALRRKQVQQATPRPAKWDLSLRADIILALVCLILFWSWRGLYASVPMLMAIGIAIVLTYLFWKLWCLLRDQNLRLHRWQLKLRGRITAAGAAFGLGVILLLGFSAQAAVIRAATWNGDRLMQSVDMRVAQALDPSRPSLDAQTRQTVNQALASYQLAGSMGRGGIGFADDPNVQLAAARLHMIKGDPETALNLLEEVRLLFRDMESVERVTLLVMDAVRPEGVEPFVNEVLDKHPQWSSFRMAAVTTALSRGRWDRAETLVSDGLERLPDSLPFLRVQSVIMLQQGKFDEAIPIMREYLERAPEDGLAWATLAQALLQTGQRVEADRAVERGLRAEPSNPVLLQECIGYYQATGRSSRARELEQRLRLGVRQ